MKRILFVFGLTCTLLVHAEKNTVAVTSAINYSYDTSEGWLQIEGRGAMSNYGKTSNTAPWSWLRGQIEEVIIDEGITSIGNYAFYQFSEMESLVFPSSITKCGKDAFAYCTNTPRVYITDLEAWLKVDWGNVGTCGISQPTMSGGYLYLNGELLDDVYIPSSITTLRTNVFMKNYGITSIHIPSSVTDFQPNAMSNCTYLTDIYYEGDMAEWCRVKLESSTALWTKEGADLWINNQLVSGKITIPSSVTKIGTYTFAYLSKITDVVIPNSVTKIESSAFYEDAGMRTLEIGTNCTSIDTYAFSGCTGLQQIRVKATIPPTIASNTFENISKNIPVIVPKGSLSRYQSNSLWKKFTNIIEEEDESIDYTPSNLTTIIEKNEVYFGWQEVEGVKKYEFDILYNGSSLLNNTLIVTYISDGWVITALDFSTLPTGTYTFDWQVRSLDNNQNPISDWATSDFTIILLDVENVNKPSSITVRKVIENGNVYIICGQQKYTLQGQLVK